jgi:hypothetical protein
MPATKEAIQNFLREAACPIGHRYTLVSISVTKRMLEQKIPTAYRFKFLEHLDGMTTKSESWLTAEMIAAVEPICDKGYEMVREAQKLGGHKALDAYAEFFSTFAVLNPSLLAALILSPSYRNVAERAATLEAAYVGA